MIVHVFQLFEIPPYAQSESPTRRADSTYIRTQSVTGRHVELLLVHTHKTVACRPLPAAASSWEHRQCRLPIEPLMVRHDRVRVPRVKLNLVDPKTFNGEPFVARNLTAAGDGVNIDISKSWVNFEQSEGGN